MKTKKKKAFTLTELLVVVIVIGVLSAVVLPKFSKVIETRRTTEAEELMGAIRTEQEKRCALDKKYLTNLSEMTDLVKADHTKNYQLVLEGTGIKASRKDNYRYTLKMPSYADGRICCESNDSNNDCEKLNKNYPLCDDLKRTPDYQKSPSSCEGEPPEAVVIPCSGPSSEACGCNKKGTRTRTCDTSTGTWSAWSACSISDTCECAGPQPKASDDCNGCGTKTREVTCDTATGAWNTGAWSECSKTAEECEEKRDCCKDADKMTDEEFMDCIADSDMETWECVFSPTAEDCVYELGIASSMGSAQWFLANAGDDSSWLNYWVNGGFKKLVCKRELPCGPIPRSTEMCNFCGWRKLEWSCDHKTGVWSLTKEGECSKTREECTQGECSLGDTRKIERDFYHCGIEKVTQECKYDYNAQGVTWQDVSSEKIKNTDAECMYGEKAPRQNYYCDLVRCKWASSGGSGSGGGNSSNGNGTPCYGWGGWTGLGSYCSGMFCGDVVYGFSCH